MNNATSTKSAFFTVQVKTKNLDELSRRYAHAAIESLSEFGGEMIAGTPAPNVLEGQWEGSWAAILRFPSINMAKDWYNSAQYEPLKALRINELTDSNQILLIEGI